MKYLSYKKCDFVNGTGARNVLWLSNCNHKCIGCFQKSSWENTGEPVTEEFIKQILKDLDKDYIDGLTLSGGDPLHKNNIDGVIGLCFDVKYKLPNKTIWLYTGYTYEQILRSSKLRGILQHIDVLVDGRYEQDLKCTGQFYGSTNQRIINVRKSLDNGGVVLYD